ncbi:MAG TPA: hypothetical protein PKG95_12745 [Anaerolineaceae bacterium]|nr:hypothetical protein [Anaerolineaceae bacterium]
MPILPRYILPEEAAKQLNVTVDQLIAWVRTGTIRGAILPGGNLAVSEASVQRKVQQYKEREIREEKARSYRPIDKRDLPEYQQFSHLQDIPIGVNEAAREFDMPATTLSGWVNRGFITVIGTMGNKLSLDKQDVAYCAYVYHQRKGRGKRIFDRNGAPYIPKLERLSLAG